MTAASHRLDACLTRLARRRMAARAMRRLATVAVASLGTAATAVMVVRLALPGAAWIAWPLTIGAVLVPLVVLPGILRRREAPWLIAGHLDTQTGSDGLVMALADLPAAHRPVPWLQRAGAMLSAWRPPGLPWRAGVAPMVAAGLLVVALLLPQWMPAPPEVRPWSAVFAPTAQRLTDLTTAGIIPPELAVQATEDLKRLSERAADGAMDQATWDALDRMEADLDAASQASAKRLADALAAADQAAKADLTPADAATAGATLAAKLADLAAAAPGLVPVIDPGDLGDLATDPAAVGKALDAAMAKAMADGHLTPAAAAALRQQLMKRMGKPGGAEGEDGGAGQPAADQAGAQRALAKALADALKAGSEGFCDTTDMDMDTFMALVLSGGLQPGNGGISRGPGHAALTKGEEIRTDGGTVEGLPPGARLNADGSVTLAETIRDTQIDPKALGAATRAAAAAFDPASADARRATIAPRHRAAVERYFATGPSAGGATPGGPPPAVPGTPP